MLWQKAILFFFVSFSLYSNTSPRAYVCLRYANLISVIDITNNTLLYNIPVTGQPQEGMAITPDGNKLYLGCIGDNKIRELNLNTNVLTEILTARSFGISITSKGIAYIGDVLQNQIIILDTLTNEVIGNITNSQMRSPDGLFIDESETILYVTNNSSSTSTYNLMQFDLSKNTIIQNAIALPADPEAVVATTNNKKAYVACQNSNVVAAIDLNTRVSTPLPYTFVNVKDLAISPDRKTAYIPALNSAPYNYSFLDTETNTVQDKMIIPRGIGYIGLNRTGSRAYISNFLTGQGYLTVVDNINKTILAEILLPAVGVTSGAFAVVVYDPDLYENLLKANQYDTIKIQNGILY